MIKRLLKRGNQSSISLWTAKEKANMYISNVHNIYIGQRRNRMRNNFAFAMIMMISDSDER